MPPFMERLRRPRNLIILGLLALLLAGAAAYGYFEIYKPEGDVSNPDVEFDASDDLGDEPELEKKKPKAFLWPTYGFTNRRTRFLDADIKPPFKRLWTVRGDGLLEYTPVLAKGVLYQVRNSGTAEAFNASNGRFRWRRKIGQLNASSPTYAKNRLFVSLLTPQKIMALSAKNGRTLWQKPLPSRSESSPVVIDGIVYFGSEDGTVYALKAKNGARKWTFQTADAVYGVSYANGRLFFGDKSGKVTAVNAENGKLIWQQQTSGASFGRGGIFYSTPAIAFGRVYIGNADRKVYSFSARDGSLAWTYTTGHYVYGGPAVANIPGLGPTVYIGSYDSSFYAIDARNGKLRWSYDSGGSISGAATIVGDIVYFSSFDAGTTGLGVKTGKVRFKWPDGRYTPVISDGKRIYLTGYAQVYGLAPKGSPEVAAAKAKQKGKAKAKRGDRRSKRRAQRGERRAQRGERRPSRQARRRARRAANRL
jgi:outer membrane protein assembly factor BamB